MIEHSTTSESRPGASRYAILMGTSLIAAVICVVLALQSPVAFWYGYLAAAYFWICVSMGGVSVALLHGTSGGRWGRAIGRPLHACVATLPVALAGCWIMALGVQHVLAWAGPESRWELLNGHQKQWLNPLAVTIRFGVFSVLWMIMSLWLNRCYLRKSRNPEYAISARLTSLGLMLVFVSFSIVVVDFLMSLTPHWFSTMFPLTGVLNCGVCGLSMVVLIHTFRLSPTPVKEEMERAQDLGNLLQAFNLMWVYLAFSQYLLIWSGDVLEEVEWYLHRRTPLWTAAAVFLFFFHFVVPFLLLLSRPLKRTPARLRGVAIILLVACLVDIAWIILPNCPASTGIAILSMVASLFAIYGVWQAVFRRQFIRLPDLPVHGEHETHALEAAVETAGGTP